MIDENEMPRVTDSMEEPHNKCHVRETGCQGMNQSLKGLLAL